MMVHTGGEDLKFPHHDNECAQCEAHNNSQQWCNCAAPAAEWLWGTPTGHAIHPSTHLRESIQPRESIQGNNYDEINSGGVSRFGAMQLHCIKLHHTADVPLSLAQPHGPVGCDYEISALSSKQTCSLWKGMPT